MHRLRGEYPYYVMDFDHVDGDKLMMSSDLVNFGGTAKLLAELAKCDVVCSNCHRERTFRRLQRPAVPATPEAEGPDRAGPHPLTLFD